MALNNQNNPHIMVVPMGSPTAAASVFGGRVSPGKNIRVLSAHLVNSAEVATSVTDFAQFELKAGSRVVASYDTRNGSLLSGEPKLMVLSSAQSKVTDSELMSVAYSEQDQGTVAFWIDVGDTGTAIPAWASAADRAVEVTTITADDSGIVVAGKLATAIGADDQFSASSAVVDIAATNSGVRAGVGSDGGGAGFLVEQYLAGAVGVEQLVCLTAVADVASSLDGEGFILYDEDGTVAFWIDVGDTGTTIPAWASAADRAVEVTTITADDAATVVAGKLATAIDADSKYGASALALKVTDAVVGARTGEATTGDDAGFSGFVITPGANGVAQTQIIATVADVGSNLDAEGLILYDATGASVELTTCVCIVNYVFI